MSDWVVAAIVLGVVLVLLYFAERKPAEAEAPKPPPAEDEPKPAAESKKAAEPEKSPDSLKSITVETKPSGDIPKLAYDEDEDVDPTLVGATDTKKKEESEEKEPARALTKKIVYDDEAALEEPTRPGALILVSATGQTDRGIRRKRNEDNLLALEDEGVYVVADGMGGYRGGEIASELVVRSIEDAFKKNDFPGTPYPNIPRRASDLARAIQLANETILGRATKAKELEGMGTTVCAARFSPNKQRLYVAHVGDSRMYRFRNNELRQMTSDHTMKDFGVTGEAATHLSRAVGIWPTVPIDILLAKPNPGDTYVLCSDGLTKMIDDDGIREILADEEAPAVTVSKLIAKANERGGKDNVTVIIIRIFAANDPAIAKVASASKPPITS